MAVVFLQTLSEDVRNQHHNLQERKHPPILQQTLLHNVNPLHKPLVLDTHKPVLEECKLRQRLYEE